MARCKECGHDLRVRRRMGKQNAGKVWCSNRKCRHFSFESHPTGPELNSGPAE